MISFLIKYKKPILVVTLTFFIGSIVYIGADSYRRGNFSLDAAEVGGEKITYRELSKAADAQARVLRNNGIDVDENMMKFINQQALSALISEAVLNQAAGHAGITVSDYEIAYDIASSPEFNINDRFSKQAYEYALRTSLGMTPAQFERQLRRSKLGDRFREFLYSHYKLTPEEIKFSYQIQQGNLKDFDANKDDFEKALLETKMETAQRAFFDDFNNKVEIKTFLQDTPQSDEE